MGSMVYSNNTVAEESGSLEDDVYMPMMAAYSVGTLDQRGAEPSHLSKSRTTCKYILYTYTANSRKVVLQKS
jgi:hypothetical protein